MFIFLLCMIHTAAILCFSSRAAFIASLKE
jgi:hypothetical protein